MSTIPIKNIYYMLAYAFQVLQENGYKSIETEEFDNIPDLCAEILIKGISMQLKRGLEKNYLSTTEVLSTIRGKIDVSTSIKETTILKNKLVCEFDEFSVNTYMHQIIKTTSLLLVNSPYVNLTRKKKLKKLMLFFRDVDVIDYHRIIWKMQYNRNNQTYRMLIGICELVIKGLLQSTSIGKTKVMDFFDEQRMCRLYEKFILEYYCKEHKEIVAKAAKIDWMVDGNKTFLPEMKSDIMLSSKEDKNKILIIDAKYYTHSMQTQYEKRSLHSGNLYQIFTYVKNKEYELSAFSHEVAGMLLYAKTDEAMVPDNYIYQMSGNQITVTNLDLNCEFGIIRKQLDDIVDGYFNN